MSTTASGEMHLRPGAIALGPVVSLAAQSARGSIVDATGFSRESPSSRIQLPTLPARTLSSIESGKYVFQELPVGVYNLTVKLFLGKYHRVHIDTTGELK